MELGQSGQCAILVEHIKQKSWCWDNHAICNGYTNLLAKRELEDVIKMGVLIKLYDSFRKIRVWRERK